MNRLSLLSVSFLLLASISCSAGALAEVRLDVVLSPKPPKLLSAFGLFTNLHGLVPSEGVRRYMVRNELFSDHAAKSRHVFIPPGKSAKFHPQEAFQFPVGSVLVKTFSFPADLRSPDTGLTKIETRVLLRQQGGWKAYAYVWNNFQTDAVLKIAGKRLQIDFTDLNGTSQSISYKVPNRNQCKGCHAINKAVTPIGPKARNLNFTPPGSPENQLSDWVAAEILSGSPPPQEWKAVPYWRDESQPVEQRARAYLDINCAHCHRGDGPASNSGLFLTYGEKSRVQWGYQKRPVAAGKGSGGFEFSIAPGEPQRSILLYRMKSREPGVMMPELGRSLVDHEAVSLISQWISELR